MFVRGDETHEFHHALDGNGTSIKECCSHQLIELNRQLLCLTKLARHAKVVEAGNLFGRDVRRRDHRTAPAQGAHREGGALQTTEYAQIRTETVQKPRYE